MAGPDPGQLAAFLASERQQESSGNYSDPDGAYGFIPSTWGSEATSAGYGAYSNMSAGQAPPAVQDAVAAYMATNNYNAYGGNWQSAAEAWYYPAWAGNPQFQNSVPAPSAGNTLTIGQYGSQVVNRMNQILAGGGAGSVTAPGSSGTTSQPAVTESYVASAIPGIPATPPANPGIGLDPISSLGSQVEWLGEFAGWALLTMIVFLFGAVLLLLGLVMLIMVFAGPVTSAGGAVAGALPGKGIAKKAARKTTGTTKKAAGTRSATGAGAATKRTANRGLGRVAQIGGKPGSDRYDEGYEHGVASVSGIDSSKRVRAADLSVAGGNRTATGSTSRGTRRSETPRSNQRQGRRIAYTQDATPRAS